MYFTEIFKFVIHCKLQSDEDEFAKLNESNKSTAVKAGGASQTNGAGQQRSDSVDSDEFQEFESYQAQNDDVTNHDDVSAGSSTENRNNEGTEIVFKNSVSFEFL